MKRTASLLILVPVIFASSCQSKISTVDLGEFNIHTTQQQKYLDSEAHSEIDADGTKNLDKPNPVTFTIDEYDNNSNYDVYYSYNYKFDDSRIEQEHHVSFNNKKISLTNLEFNKQYYFKVVTNRHTVKQGTFKTTPGIIRNLEIDGMKNIRDMGGYQTDLGYFKPNMIFRTSELNNSKMDSDNDSYITDKGADTMINDLKIKTEIDLREINEDIPEEYKTDSILKVKYGANVKLVQLNIDYDGFNILVSDGRKQKIQDFFKTISDINNYPICFHCHIGTDRTGMFAAAIHSLLGGSEDHIYRDYMFSNFACIGGPRSESGVNNSYMNALHDRTEGTIEKKAYNLLKEQVGIPTSQLDNIRNILLD